MTTALITGANKGIGLATARLLGQRGCTVLPGSRDADRGEGAVRSLRAESLDVHLVAIDVTDPASVAGPPRRWPPRTMRWTSS